MRETAKIIGTILICLLSFPALGQDISYSQYYNCPLNLNPAETGNFQGDWRSIMNYRNQWSALGIPYQTLCVSYDQQYYFKGQHFSPGFYIMQDNSGSSALDVTHGYISLAYEKEFRNNYFRIGFQAGWQYASVDLSKLTFPGNYNNSTGNFESGYGSNLIPGDHASFFDFNLGASWKTKIRKFEPEIGVAFYHLNEPNESFFNGASVPIPMRNVIYASLRTSLQKNIFIKPDFMLETMNGANNMLLGCQGGLSVEGNQLNVKEVYAGVYVRNGIVSPMDAFIVMAGTQTTISAMNVTFNISYDFNVSPLSTYSNYQGAFELSIIIKSISTIIKTYTIPCERM